MTRRIFLQEFKRSLYQTLLILFPFELGLIATERIVSGRLFSGGLLGGTPDAVVDIVISALLGISAFVIGVGSFYRLTDRHVWFVHSLPVSRVQFWTLIVSANIGVVVLTTPVVFLLRPSLWTRSDSWSIGSAWPYALGGYLVLFGAGCCFAMLFRNVTAITIVGAAIVGVTLNITLLFANMPGASTGSLRFYGILVSNRTSPEFWLLSSLVLSVLYLGLSLHFFTKGEFRLLTSRVKNCALVALLVMAYPMLNGLALETGYFDRRVYPEPDASVSDDGRYLAIFERGSSDFITRIYFVDIVSGMALGTYESYALVAPIWSKSNPALNVVSIQSPLRRLGYVLPPSDSVVRLSPEARVLDHVTFGFSEILSVQPDRAGDVLVLTKSGGQAKLFSISAGFKKELLTTAMKDTGVIHPEASENIVAMYSGTRLTSDGRVQLEQAWSVGVDVRKLTWAIENDDRARGEFLLDGKLKSRAAALAGFKQQFPSASGPFFYIFSATARYFDRGHRFFTSPASCWGCRESVPNIDAVSTKHVFAISIDRNAGTGKFLKYDRQHSLWRALGETLPLGSQLRTQSSPLSQDGGIWNSGTNIGGTRVIGDNLAIFYVTRGTERDGYLYDADTDRRFLLSSSALGERSICFVDERVRGIDGFLLRCPDSAFIYNQRDGLKKAQLLKGYPLYLYNDGSQISASRGQVSHISAGGQERRLWPLQ